MPTESRFNSESIIVRAPEEFIPPHGFVRRVRAVLSWIDPADLEGIELVFLFDEVPTTPPLDNPGLAEALRDGLLLFAAYKRNSKARPAHIMLMVQNLCKPIPRLLRNSPALTVWIAENLAHEVGHHVIAERRCRLRPKTAERAAETEEEFADRFAVSITSKLKSSYCVVGKVLLRIAAVIDYYKGAYHFVRRRHRIAADYFYMAHQLNPNDKAAGRFYWKAKASETSIASDASSIST